MGFEWLMVVVAVGAVLGLAGWVVVLIRKNYALTLERELVRQELQHLQKAQMESSKVGEQRRLEFEELAQKILDAKAKNYQESAAHNFNLMLAPLLNPLQEKIHSFEKSVEEKYHHESKERFVLKSEIERLIQLSDRITFETKSLTEALKGDSKIQGNWGELVLEKILEASGLRRDHEFVIQESLRSDTGELFRPDVIIKLPENRQIIVDAKVSLTAFERIHQLTGNSDEEVRLREKGLKDHLKSLENHVASLSDKHYQKLKNVNSPEFVFLFIPIESAYLMAMQADPEISLRAWNKGIAIVTATTLLTSLKTVASIWRLEKQNKNALEIAREGGRLYDKFVGFLDDFEKVGKTFETGTRHYQEALAKLKLGPGNVFRKMEQLKEMGATPSKQIPPTHLDPVEHPDT